jgi:hypothetical protein
MANSDAEDYRKRAHVMRERAASMSLSEMADIRESMLKIAAENERLADFVERSRG